MLWESVGEALVDIRTHKLRSFLSVLGVTIGVGSVIVMVSMIEGARNRVVREFELIGSNLIFVVYERSKAQEEGKEQEHFVAFRDEDISLIREHCPLVAHISPRDKFVYVPLPVAQQYLTGNRYIHAFLAKAVSPEKIEQAADG